MKEIEQQIFRWIRENPMISQNELAKLAHTSRSSVAAYISDLEKTGYLRGKGYIVNPRDYVVVVGGVTIDTFGIPEPQVLDHKSKVGKVKTEVGGLGRNSAVNLSRLGIPTYFISVFGYDHAGEIFKEDAMKNDVDITYTAQIPDTPTSRYLYINQVDHNRIVGVDDSSIHNKMTPEFMKKRATVLRYASMIVLDPNLPQATINWICDNFNQPIIADSINRVQRLESGLKSIDTVVLSRSALASLTKSKEDGHLATIKEIKQIHEAGVKHIFVYDSEDGFIYQNYQDTMATELGIQNIKNVNGVGSSVIAGIIYSRRQNLSMKDEFQNAVRCAQITMQTNANVSDRISPQILITHK